MNIVVFGAGGDRDNTKRAIMGKIAENYAQHIFVTSDNPRFEDPDKIIEDIIKGIENKSNVIIELNRAKAIYDAVKLAKSKSNCVVLVLGKGDEENQIIYDQKLPFNDKNIITEILKQF